MLHNPQTWEKFYKPGTDELITIKKGDGSDYKPYGDPVDWSTLLWTE